ncbi:YedE family putative selenium transporter [Eubacterium multiforme]|uniref:YedE family putative selenium metabolism protein n=1 Tax=Eubacterium multiforme TaxID=83339 RepID=A0ABT9UV30_9FIRM|nr:YedE family putative selenium transporter [Eubacterium multiforme]MDQ0150184.1 YedE family putative selenium metabolism protein [Eubacterium multiforme]
MNLKNEKISIIVAGIIIGIISVSLVILGNPANMGFCIACFLRDTAGSLGLHRAQAVQYIRPEIIGLVLGAFIISLTKKEFSSRGGSSPVTRFVLGFFIMIGCLMFLGCPFRMILRLAAGDWNAIFGFIGLVLGILLGIYFLNRGYSLKRTYKLTSMEGTIVPIVQVVLLILLVAAPTFILFTPEGKGPGAKHAAIIISLLAGVIVGIIAQRTRLCMVGGIRDLVLFGQWKMLYGFISILISAFVMSLIVGGFNPGFAGQPVAHTDGLWNLLGMVATGFGSVLLGGCPLRQLILTGEGNTDSAITVIGLIAGAAFAHNFALASSGKGPTLNGKIAVIIGIIVMFIIAIVNTKKQKS